MHYFVSHQRPAAGSAFCQAARLHMQMQNKLDSATSFVDAGNAYKKSDPQGERGPNNVVISCRRSFIGYCTVVEQYVSLFKGVLQID